MWRSVAKKLLPSFASFTSFPHPHLPLLAGVQARQPAFSPTAAAIGRFRVERTKESSDPPTRPTDLTFRPPSLESCFPVLPACLRLLFFSRDSIMSTASPSLPPSLSSVGRSHFVFLPMSFAVHLQTQFSRASGPFRGALPTSHLRSGVCPGDAIVAPRSICCVI